MVVVNFPGPGKRPETDIAELKQSPAQPADSNTQLRELLLKTYLSRAVRGRRKAKSPVSVIARALHPHNGSPGVGATRIDPLEMLSEWLGLALGNEAREPIYALIELKRAHPSLRPPLQPPGRAEGDGGGRKADQFWAIWMEHRGQMKGLALRLMQGNEADAEDALSAAMLRAERAFDPSAIHNPGAWFSRLVRNACIDHYRHRSRVPTMGDGVEATLDGTAPASPAASLARSGEDELLSSEGLRETLCAILELPEELMEPLLLRCFAERSYDDIARDMGLSNAAVRKRVQLARQHLLDIL